MIEQQVLCGERVYVVFFVSIERFRFLGYTVNDMNSNTNSNAGMNVTSVGSNTSVLTLLDILSLGNVILIYVSESGRRTFSEPLRVSMLRILLLILWVE